MNEVYRKSLPDSQPARTTIAVGLVRGAKIEMDDYRCRQRIVMFCKCARVGAEYQISTTP